MCLGTAHLYYKWLFTHLVHFLGTRFFMPPDLFVTRRSVLLQLFQNVFILRVIAPDWTVKYCYLPPASRRLVPVSHSDWSNAADVPGEGWEGQWCWWCLTLGDLLSVALLWKRINKEGGLWKARLTTPILWRQCVCVGRGIEQGACDPCLRLLFLFH